MTYMKLMMMRWKININIWIFNTNFIKLSISKKNFKLPPYIIIKNYGLYENIEAISAAKEMLDCFIEILLRIDFNYTPKTLSKEQENELLNWDAEIYRQTIN